MTVNSPFQRFAGLSKWLTTFVVAALVVAGVVMLASRGSQRTVTVNFPNVNSLYVGSDVRILGVAVGTVKQIDPQGDYVRVKIAYDGKVKLPNDVKATVISPSLVGDRFVQFAPAYTGGAVLADNATIDIKRTAVPLELDQVYSSLDQLATALGPQGANKNGSLSHFISSNATALKGQGAQLNETIKNFSKLSTTLSNNKDALFGSLSEVETFVAMLKKNDSSVRSFNDSTAKVAGVLAGERTDLAGTLKSLGIALNDVHGLIRDNHSALRSNVSNLTSISQVLAANEKSLREVITAAPTALSNVAFTYNSKYGSLDTRGNLLEVLTGSLKDPKAALCALLGQSGAPGDLCTSLGGILGPLASSGGALPLPRTAVASGSGTAPELVSSSISDMLAVN